MSSKKSRQAKAAQNYEQHPPRCSSCAHFRRAQRASPPVVVMGQEMAPALKYMPAHCFIGSFAVDPCGVCDLWQHAKTGEVLADSPTL